MCVYTCVFLCVCVRACASDGNKGAEAVSGGPLLHLVIKETYSIIKQ